MLLAVPGWVGAGIFQAEVGGEVDHVANLGQQLGHEALRSPVRQGTEHNVRSVSSRRLGRYERQRRVRASKRRVHIRHGHALVGTCRGCYHFEVRVGSEKAQQLSPV